jgi:hypothetical protein
MNVRHVDDSGRRLGHGALPRSVVLAVARRPTTWVPAVSAAVRLAPRGWWRRPPFLPVPDSRYWRFRMQTAYGDEDAVPPAHDVDDVIRWSRRARAPRR